MTQRYDAVIIGAGLGGLSAAACLARKGRRVLLLERHNVPGGYATSFVRGRFEFEVALHELSDIGTNERPGALKGYLDWLGVGDLVTFLPAPSLYRAVFPGVDISLPPGEEPYTETLCAAFPDDAEGIRRFLALVFRIGDELEALAALQHPRFPGSLVALAGLPLKMRALPRYFFAAWGEVLSRYVKSRAAQAVLSMYWGYFGLPPSRASFFYFAVALASYVRLGATYIKGRSQALAGAFVSVIERNGGEVRLSCGARRILTQGGRVKGVLTDDDRQVETSIVVSNADPVTTARELIGTEHLPSSFFTPLRSMPPAASTFNVYLGVDHPADGVMPLDHEVFINDNDDFDDHYRRGDMVGAPAELAATCYNRVWPEISPPGTSLVTLTTIVYGRPWMELDPRDYHARKEAVADAMIDMAEQVMPGLRRYTEVVEAATPLTNMRYAGALAGSIYGADATPFNHTLLRLSQKGPLGGLYFAGAWTSPGGGYSPSMLSGRFAASLANAELNRA